ncbi:hypothetical protein C2845_PM09G16460 [Panicum miliaceum]|uniref:Uncharacterized protein n=1 Tax=Panicum miliaceum TaxID=4540 RepID=A0A3L6S0G4_PANMI|nr:hypothetical protein C2845_PM09G16460 [Panicum miliaceum]
MGLSPCSQPRWAPPFFVHGGDTSHGLNASTPSTMSGGFVPGHRPSVPHYQPWSDEDDEVRASPSSHRLPGKGCKGGALTIAWRRRAEKKEVIIDLVRRPMGWRGEAKPAF